MTKGLNTTYFWLLLCKFFSLYSSMMDFAHSRPSTMGMLMSNSNRLTGKMLPSLSFDGSRSLLKKSTVSLPLEN